MPNILFLGDIVGRPGRSFVIERLADLRTELEVDIVIVNAENAAGGAGVTGKIITELHAAGVDAITLGDHVWDQKNFENDIDQFDRVCRPANLPAQNPGRSHLIVEIDGFRLGIFTVLGRNYLTLKSSCPFTSADTKIAEIQSLCDAVLVEAHMEATSEKVALGWYLDGRAAAVVGTHTHIPTNDARILQKGTAYQTDAGMCGDYDSVIGMNKQNSINKFLKISSDNHYPSENNASICGVIVDADIDTGLANNIKSFIFGGILKNN